MKLRKTLKITILTLCLCLTTGVGIFLYNAHHGYTINKGFTMLPLKYKTDTQNSLTMVQLPSPANVLLKRYTATISLFAEAMYEENKTSVTFFIIGFGLLVILLILLLIIKLNHRLALLWILIKDTEKYMTKRFKELFKGKS